ncbi:hypothetical protein J5O02_09025, partial [Streptococcus suis]|uniref:hypothetical protein n=1 Tax=Streptococcus suis TaxID=1307 RepID=UPI001ABDF5E3
FLSPLPHDSQAWESLWGSPVAGVHGGLSPQMYDMPVVQTKRLEYSSRFVYLYSPAIKSPENFSRCHLSM